jgi:DNA-binding beta-propeller fold protein YncE
MASVVNGQPHPGGSLVAALVASAGVFVATLLVGPATVAHATPSGRVANVATSTAGPAIKVSEEPVAIAITPDGRTAYVVNGSSVTPIHM